MRYVDPPVIQSNKPVLTDYLKPGTDKQEVRAEHQDGAGRRCRAEQPHPGQDEAGAAEIEARRLLSHWTNPGSDPNQEPRHATPIRCQGTDTGITKSWKM